MPDETLYNPLDYDNLGESIARAILVYVSGRV